MRLRARSHMLLGPDSLRSPRPVPRFVRDDRPAPGRVATRRAERLPGLLLTSGYRPLIASRCSWSMTTWRADFSPTWVLDPDACWPAGSVRTPWVAGERVAYEFGCAPQPLARKEAGLGGRSGSGTNRGLDSRSRVSGDGCSVHSLGACRQPSTGQTCELKRNGSAVRVLIHDQTDRDAIASGLLRYLDRRGDERADIIESLTLHPEARRIVVRALGEIEGRGEPLRGRARRAISCPRSAALSRRCGPKAWGVG